MLRTILIESKGIMKTEKEIIEEMLLEIANRLWTAESRLIRDEAHASEKGLTLCEDPDFMHLQGVHSAYRDVLIRFKAKLGNSEYSLFFNRLVLKPYD